MDDLELREQLDRIEKYSLLAAKNVLCFDDVALLTGLSKSHLYKLTCSHQIPHYKPNIRYLTTNLMGSKSILIEKK